MQHLLRCLPDRKNKSCERRTTISNRRTKVWTYQRQRMPSRGAGAKMVNFIEFPVQVVCLLLAVLVQRATSVKDGKYFIQLAFFCVLWCARILRELCGFLQTNYAHYEPFRIIIPFQTRIMDGYNTKAENKEEASSEVIYDRVDYLLFIFAAELCWQRNQCLSTANCIGIFSVLIHIPAPETYIDELNSHFCTTLQALTPSTTRCCTNMRQRKPTSFDFDFQTYFKIASKTCR